MANLWVAVFFLCGAAGEGCTHRCRMPRSDGVCLRLLAAIASCASAKAVLAGNQTLAAILFRSEAQDKAKSTELVQKRARVVAQAQGALELACFSSVFQALAHARRAFPRYVFHSWRMSLVRILTKSLLPGGTAPRRARGKRELNHA